jgi:hypothetical protein
METSTVLIGERRVALRFLAFPENARAALLKVITTYQAQLQAAIAAKIPQGRTGAIRAALQGGVDSTTNKVRGWVSLAGGDRKTVILPAVALEYGSHAAIKVKAKQDRILYTVYGRYIAPMLVDVEAYNRTTNIAAQRFMRGPLDQLAKPAVNAMAAALADAAKSA